MVSDVELRRQKEIADRNEALRTRLNISQAEIDEAQQLVNRKLAGQRRQAGSTAGVERAFTSIINRPENLRQLSQTTALQSEAERLGFSSTEEFVGAQQQFATFDGVRPTTTEEERLQSLPADIRERGPEEVEARQTIGFVDEPIRQTLRPTPFEEARQQSFSPEFRDQPVSEKGDISFVSAIGDVLFGEAGEQLVGFDFKPKILPGFIPQKKDITAREIKTGLESGALGFPGKVISVGVLTTPVEVGVIGGFAASPFFLPSIVSKGVGVGIGVLGAKTALDPTLLPEERVFGGIVGGLAGTGLVFEAVPFVRGRLKPTSKVKIAEEGFEFFKVGETEVGLIQPGPVIIKLSETQRLSLIKSTAVDLPPTSPLRRGGFQVKPSEKQMFLGEDQILTTSQIGFFKPGKDIPLSREFFVTPQEPFLKIGETRVSRLGLQDALSFKVPKDPEIGFGLPGKPQIGILKGGKVGRVETREQFRIGTGTELEAIKGFGELTDVQLIGGTRIKGQFVEVFEFKVGDQKISKDLIGKDTLGSLDFKQTTTRVRTRIQVESTIATGLSSSLRFTSPTSPFTTPTISKPSFKFSDIISLPKTPGISPPFSPPKTPGISPPIIPTISPPISPPKSPPIFPPTKQPPPRFRLDFEGADFVGDLRATRKFKKTPSLGDVIKFDFGLNVPKRSDFISQTGFVGGGIGMKLSRIELGSLLGEVTKKKRRKK